MQHGASMRWADVDSDDDLSSLSPVSAPSPGPTLPALDKPEDELDLASTETDFVSECDSNPSEAFATPPKSPKKPHDAALTQTVMLKGLMSQLSQQQLVQTLQEAGYKNTFDYVYVPARPREGANKGLAFVNFKVAAVAANFRERFHLRPWPVVCNRALLQVLHADVQGLYANLQRFGHRRGTQPWLETPWPDARRRTPIEPPLIEDAVVAEAKRALQLTRLKRMQGVRVPTSAAVPSVRACFRCRQALPSCCRFCPFCGFGV